MCVALHKPSGVPVPSLETLYSCWQTNPDGAGICYPSAYKRGKVLICKGIMSWDDFEKAYKEHGLETMEAIPLLIHFRIATSGLVDGGNTHPFPVKKSMKELRHTLQFSDYALVHNGVLQLKPENAFISDTMQFVANLARCGGNIAGKFLKMDGNIDGGRMALMDGEGKVCRLGDWIDCDGVFYSNDIWQLNEYDQSWAMDMMYEDYAEMYPDEDGPPIDEFAEEWLEMNDWVFEPNPYQWDNYR